MGRRGVVGRPSRRRSSSGDVACTGRPVSAGLVWPGWSALVDSEVVQVARAQPGDTAVPVADVAGCRIHPGGSWGSVASVWPGRGPVGPVTRGGPVRQSGAVPGSRRRAVPPIRQTATGPPAGWRPHAGRASRRAPVTGRRSGGGGHLSGSVGSAGSASRCQGGPGHVGGGRAAPGRRRGAGPEAGGRRAGPGWRPGRPATRPGRGRVLRARAVMMATAGLAAVGAWWSNQRPPRCSRASCSTAAAWSGCSTATKLHQRPGFRAGWCAGQLVPVHEPDRRG